MIIDGGLGFELAERGFEFTTSLWSGEAVLRAPELLVATHRAYLAAGATVLATATYQMSHTALRKLGCDDGEIDAVFARAVALAREAIDEERVVTPSVAAACVAASLGPFGATVGDGSEYTGKQHLDRAALGAFHAQRLRSVVRAEPDLIMFETIPTRTEALVIADVAQELGLTGVWMSFPCKDTGLTFGGNRVADIAAELEAYPGIAVIGINCTAPPLIAPLVRALQMETAKPISICPNLGQHWETDSRALAGGATEAAFLRHVAEWLALGIEHIGGCCGAAPSTIAALSAIAEDRHSASGSVRR